MAFMVPVVKKDYNLYGSSLPSSRGSMGTPRGSSLSSSPRGSSLSSSPSTASSFVGSPRHSQTPGFSKSESSSSLHSFHSKLLDKLKNTFHSGSSQR